MIKNYLKIGLRSLSRHKVYTFINIAGLAIGIACCIVMLLYVQDELSFDAFHQKSNRIYRLIETQQSPDQGDRHLPFTMGPAGPAMVSEFPDVSNCVRIRTRWAMGRFPVRYGEKLFYEGDIMIAEQSFFEVFDFKLRQGNSATALVEPQSVVMTEKSAYKYFGDENPMGKTLDAGRFGKITVTGVLKDPPDNSHLQFSMLFSFSSLPAQDQRWQQYIDSWKSMGFLTYIVTNKPIDVAAFNTRLIDFVNQHRGKDLQAEIRRQITVQPLRDIHFKSSGIESDVNHAKSDIIYVYIFSIIAGFILLIACINYMNLATARSIKRAREIGMRKVLGAFRRQLVVRYLSESILLTAIALILALAIAQLVLPLFNSLAAKNLAIHLASNPLLIPGLLLLTFLVGIVSGSYPAFYLAGMRPSAVLKGEIRTGGDGAFMRRVLMITQFTLSIIMIVSTLVAHRQLSYIHEKNLGFNKDHLIVVDINSGGTRSNAQTIKSEMLRIPSVKSVSTSSRVPGEWKNLVEIGVATADASLSDLRTMYFIGADEDFLKTFEINLLAGRNFSPDMGTDTTAVLLNETAAAMLHWKVPIGKEIRVPMGDDEKPLVARVIGVVKDFNFRSLHEKVGPMVIGHWNNPIQLIDYFTARVNTADISATLKSLETIHEQFDQETPFEYNFLDERLNNFYKRDIRVGKIFTIAAVLTILIACLGIFGLASFTTEQRTKEIGVRKVLGASVSDLIMLISRQFAQLVLIAFVIATPIGYFVMSRWLQNFAYRVSIEWWVFAIAGLAALLITLVTISYQSIRAALANPVDSLRYE
jgi:putative ABC transport system permease protein